MSEVVRFGVSLERDLLTAFDRHSERKGFANLRGPAAAANELADRLRSSRGVLQSSCALTAIEAAPEHHVFHDHAHK